MALIGIDHHRSAGPSHLQAVPPAEWVRRLNNYPPPLRGALANIIDWDFYLHLPVKATILKSPSYLQIQLWAAPYPAGAHDAKELEEALIEMGYPAGFANRRVFGDWEKQQWNPYVPMKGREVAS